jgi:hypothetical protein
MKTIGEEARQKRNPFGPVSNPLSLDSTRREKKDEENLFIT